MLLLGPGKKFHALELMPECGTDPAKPACELKNVCPQNEVLCAPPRWEPCFYGWLQTFPTKKDPKTHKEVETKPPVCHPWQKESGAWVRIESREAAAERFVNIAKADADVAQELGSEWPEGAADFGRALLVQSYWSTGLREDIQRGRTRGPGGEVCLMDLKVKTLRANTTPELAALPDEALIAAVVGLGYDELHRCFYAGAKALLRARRARNWKCPTKEPMEAMFALYHTGSYCSSLMLGWDWCPECKRVGTLNKFRGRPETIIPEWADLSKYLN